MVKNNLVLKQATIYFLAHQHLYTKLMNTKFIAWTDH